MLDFLSLRGTPWSRVWPLMEPALIQTLQMVASVMALTLLLGIPLALVLHNTGRDGLFPAPRLHRAVSWIVNLARSLPFLILMVAIIPVTRLIAGTTIGVPAAIVPMTAAAVPYFARLVETSLREVPREVVDIARACGGSNLQTMFRVQLPEALPGIISNATIMTINVIGLSAMAGAVGAGGIGDLAINYGYNRFDNNLMLATVLALLVIVQIIQFGGDRLARSISKR